MEKATSRISKRKFRAFLPRRIPPERIKLANRIIRPLAVGDRRCPSGSDRGVSIRDAARCRYTVDGSRLWPMSPINFFEGSLAVGCEGSRSSNGVPVALSAIIDPSGTRRSRNRVPRSPASRRRIAEIVDLFRILRGTRRSTIFQRFPSSPSTRRRAVFLVLPANENASTIFAVSAPRFSLTELLILLQSRLLRSVRGRRKEEREKKYREIPGENS